MARRAFNANNPQSTDLGGGELEAGDELAGGETGWTGPAASICWRGGSVVVAGGRGRTRSGTASEIVCGMRDAGDGGGDGGAGVGWGGRAKP